MRLRECRVLYMDSTSRIEVWGSGTSINFGYWQVGTRTQVSLDRSGPFDVKQGSLEWSRFLSVNTPNSDSVC